jgi:hypothetical protein
MVGKRDGNIVEGKRNSRPQVRQNVLEVRLYAIIRVVAVNQNKVPWVTAKMAYLGGGVAVSADLGVIFSCDL